MFVEFSFSEGTSARTCISNFDEVAARLKKGKIKSKDLPTINEAFSIIKKMIEDVAKKQGMTYEQYVEFMRKKEREERERLQKEENASADANDKSKEDETVSNPLNKPRPDPDPENESDKGDGKANPKIGNPDGKPPEAKKKTRDGRNKPEGGKPPGSGKTPISELASKTTPLAIVGIAQGGSCPFCREGTMHPVEPGVIGRIQVSATFTFEEILVEKFRCNSCSQAIAATVPPEISEDHIRGASFGAAASLLVMRHHLAVPNLRIERLNGWLGTPLSDSRQWDIMRDGALSLIRLYEAILKFAADAGVQILDDGWCRIICFHRAIREEIKAAELFGLRKEDLRTGVNTTVILGYEDEHAVCVYISGRAHQGENAHIINGLRTSDSPVIRMTDAASKATATHQFPERDPRGFILSHAGKTIIDSRVQVVHCLTHLRNKFEELANHAPELCAFILSRISRIYSIDDEAVTAGFGPQERLSLHQVKSSSFVEEIRQRVMAELATKSWLPREPIAKALGYAKDNLDSCTAFLRLAGCPLDSNPAERGIIPVVRHRLSSLAYQTDRGALVGDISMTLSGCAILSQKNPIEYTSRCLEFSGDVAKNPEAWFPWCYESRWKELKDLRTADRESRAIEGYRPIHRKIPLPEDPTPLPAKPESQESGVTLN